jgi:hypothetical protein
MRSHTQNNSYNLRFPVHSLEEVFIRRRVLHIDWNYDEVLVGTFLRLLFHGCVVGRGVQLHAKIPLLPPVGVHKKFAPIESCTAKRVIYCCREVGCDFPPGLRLSIVVVIPGPVRYQVSESLIVKLFFRPVNFRSSVPFSPV